MVYVNFDSRLSLLILESSCMLKMELQVPIITKALLFRKDHFTLVCDTLQVNNYFNIDSNNSIIYTIGIIIIYICINNIVYVE